MKYISLLVLMFCSISFADGKRCETKTLEQETTEQLEINTEVPAKLIKKTYRICDENGANCANPLPSQNFKLVPREQQFIVTRTAQNWITDCVTEAEERIHRVSLLVGSSPKSNLAIDRSNAPDRVSASTTNGTMGGVQYQLKLTDRLSFGVQGQSSNLKEVEAGAGMLGWDF